MRTIREVKPSLDELMHFGVLGMKWGHTRAKATGDQIRAARVATRKQVNKINTQRANFATAAKGTPKRDNEKVKLDVLEKIYKKNPERVVATRMTRGEKIVGVLLGGPLGLAAIAGSSAVSRRIERKQELGKYDK